MGRFRYRFQAVLDAADDAARAAARALAVARRDVRRAALELDGVRAADPASSLARSPSASSFWLVRAIDVERRSVWRRMRERACIHALADARAVAERRRAEYERARRRYDRFARHRERIREAFDAEAAAHDERERDEANAGLHERRAALGIG